MSRGERKKMITRAHPDLSLSRQCQVLAISRSSFYYTPKNESCSDGYGRGTAPVGSFKPNYFGVYDTVGNTFEFVEDCWHGDYAGAPKDGSAWMGGGDCSMRVLRGGSGVDGPRNLRSANRYRNSTGIRNYNSGFRIARNLP